jgi:hypothetical protein
VRLADGLFMSRHRLHRLARKEFTVLTPIG